MACLSIKATQISKRLKIKATHVCSTEIQNRAKATYAFTSAGTYKISNLSEDLVSYIVVDGETLPYSKSIKFENTSDHVVEFIFSETFKEATDLSYAFSKGVVGLKKIDFLNTDLSKIVRCLEMFATCQDLASVKFNYTFTPEIINGFCDGCSSLSTITMSLFGIDGRITSARYAFRNCSSLMSFNVSSIASREPADLTGLFYGCSNLQSISFNTSNYSTYASVCKEMFYGCSSLTQANLYSLKVESCKNFTNMFRGCTELNSVSNLSLSPTATNFTGMFYGCSALETLDTSHTAANSGEQYGDMFYGCSSLKIIDAKRIISTSAKNLSRMFRGCTSLTSFDLYGPELRNVITMEEMFYGCSSLNNVVAESFKNHTATNLNSMFYRCSSLMNFAPAYLLNEKVEYANFIFTRSGLKTIKLTDCSFSGLISAEYMFSECDALQNVISKTDIPIKNQAHLRYMFNNCVALRGINFEKFKFTNIFSTGIFNGCKKLEYIEIRNESITPAGLMIQDIFNGCINLACIKLHGKLRILDTSLTSIGGSVGINRRCNVVIHSGLSDDNTASKEIVSKVNINPNYHWFNIEEDKNFIIGNYTSETVNYNLLSEDHSTLNGKTIVYDKANNIEQEITGIQSSFTDTSATLPVHGKRFMFVLDRTSNLNSMFKSNHSITEALINICDLSNNGATFTDIDSIFESCVNLKEVDFLSSDLSQKDLSFDFAFYNCTALTKCVFGKPFGIRYFKEAFSNCEALTEVELNADFSLLYDNRMFDYLFNGCKSLINVTFTGKMPLDIEAMEMFAGVTKNGKLYINEENDYDAIIANLPSNWTYSKFAMRNHYER